MSDDRSEKKEKKEREEREKKEKKEKEKKEKDKSTSGKGHRFLGIPNPITSFGLSKKDVGKPSGDPHSSYTTDPTSPGDDARQRSNSGSKFGSLRPKSGVPPEALASPAMSPAPSKVPATPDPSTPGGLSSSTKPSPSTSIPAQPVDTPKRAAELINDHENIQPMPGPLDDPDVPKQKPGETLINRIILQATNIGVLIACVLLSWCIGALGMSFVWTILLVIALHKTDWKIKKEGWVTYYRAQERKRLHQEALNADFEKMTWLRILLNKAWPVYSHYMITTTRVQTAKAIEENFAKNKPPMVDNVVLDRVDFGTIPPEINSMKGYMAHQERDGRIVESNNVFQVDTNIVYKGDFTLTAKVYVRIAPLMPAVPLPITINGISFEGRARCIVTLLPEPPFIEQAEIAMVTMPKVDFKVTPMGAVDVMSISTLDAMVQATIDDILKGMLVLPNRFVYRMPGAPVTTLRSAEGMVNASAATSLVKMGKQATKSNFVKPAVRRVLGTLKVEAIEARNLKAMDANGKSDPFLKLRIGGIKKKTKIIEKTLDPKWNESFEFTVTNENPKELYFACFDYDKGIGNSNDLIGEGTYDFSELAPEQTLDFWLAMGAQLGDIRFRLTWYPDPSA